MGAWQSKKNDISKHLTYNYVATSTGSTKRILV